MVGVGDPGVVGWESRGGEGGGSRCWWVWGVQGVVGVGGPWGLFEHMHGESSLPILYYSES